MSLSERLGEYMMTCPSKAVFGMECPGCGMQRSFLLLLDGKVGESIQMYPALIPIMLTLIYLVLHLRYRFKHGARNLMWMHGINATIILVNYVAKFV